MMYTGLYLEDQLDDRLGNADWPELELWGDVHGARETSEYFLALQKLPTEQELLEMEGDQDETILDDRLLQRERRTALRH